MIYKTGDRVFWRKEGNLEYIGRVDNQVKIFGQRIELGEIEANLLQHPNIGQAIILALNRSAYEKFLCAYVVLKNQLNLSVQDIKDFLRKNLSNEKIPEIIFVVDKIPLNISGKVDQESLAKMVFENKLEMNSSIPKSPVQKKLVAIWQELLKIGSIELDDDFSSLGGRSILLMRLHDRISKAFHYEITMSELFSTETIRKQAKLLEKKDKMLYETAVVAFQSKGKKLPVFLLPPVSNQCVCFFSLVKYLKNFQPVYALIDPSDQINQCQFKSINEMANFFCEIIRKTQPKGPYQLVGYSFGVQLAIAISRILVEAGEKIKFLGIVDGWAKFPEYCANEQWFRQRMQSLKEEFQTDNLKIDLAWHRMQLLLNNKLELLPTKVILFKSTGDQGFSLNDMDEYNHWLPWAVHGIERYLIPGDHDDMLSEPHVQELATILQRKLDLRGGKS